VKEDLKAFRRVTKPYQMLLHLSRNLLTT